MDRKDFRRARRHAEVSVGESVRIIRELQGLSQNELAELTGISQPTLSGIENNRVNLGVERAKILARALKCHPAVLVFPGWDVSEDAAWKRNGLKVSVSFRHHEVLTGCNIRKPRM